MKNFLRESVDWTRINCPLPSSSSGSFPHNIFKRKNPGEDVTRLDLKGLSGPRKSVYHAFLKSNYRKGDLITQKVEAGKGKGGWGRGGVGRGERECRKDRRPEFLSFRSSPFPLNLLNVSAHLTMMA